MRWIIAGKENETKNYTKMIQGLGIEVLHSLEPADIKKADALILPGGRDLDPSVYGEPLNGSIDVDIQEDKAQMAMLEEALNAWIPVLGICRGHQLINVYYGGTLIQDIASSVQYPLEHRRIKDIDAIHLVEVSRHSWLYPLYGERFMANSSHHQAVLRCGDGLVKEGYAPDGITEVLRDPKRPVYGVQFHPERMTGNDTVPGETIFRFLADQCGR